MENYSPRETLGCRQYFKFQLAILINTEGARVAYCFGKLMCISNGLTCNDMVHDTSFLESGLRELPLKNFS